MKLIKPTEISSRILTLLEESDERVVIVSPYIKIAKWIRLLKKLRELIDRGVRLEIYVRDDPTNFATYEDLDQLELKYKKIPFLHAKFYMNEKCGIFTSMNLLLSSELNTLEIGYVTETWKDYDELLAYYHKHIQMGKPCLASTADGLPADLSDFQNCILEELKGTTQNVWPWFDGNVLHLTTGVNNFQVLLGEGRLMISADLKYGVRTKKNDEQAAQKVARKIGQLSKMKIDIQSCEYRGRIALNARAHKKLESLNLKGMLKAEEPYIIERICRLVEVTGHLEA